MSFRTLDENSYEWCYTLMAGAHRGLPIIYPQLLLMYRQPPRPPVMRRKLVHLPPLFHMLLGSVFTRATACPEY